METSGIPHLYGSFLMCLETCFTLHMYHKRYFSKTVIFFSLISLVRKNKKIHTEYQSFHNIPEMRFWLSHVLPHLSYQRGEIWKLRLSWNLLSKLRQSHTLNAGGCASKDHTILLRTTDVLLIQRVPFGEALLWQNS